MMKTSVVLVAVVLLALVTAAPAYGGPTASVDLLLGTSAKAGGLAAADSTVPPSQLYTAGFGLRAGWRFDIGPLWLLPEVGGGYVVERFQPSQFNGHVGRLLVGGRIGVSGTVRPDLRIEPALFAHGGGGWYQEREVHGPAYDVGFSLDFRIMRRFIVGAHVGYDAVMYPTGIPITTPTGLAYGSVTITDPWVSYGVHGGFLFW